VPDHIQLLPTAVLISPGWGRQHPYTPLAADADRQWWKTLDRGWQWFQHLCSAACPTGTVCRYQHCQSL